MKKSKKKARLIVGLDRETFWSVLISLFFLVGIIGIASPNYRETLVPLSAFHLLLTFFVLVVSRQGKRDAFLLFTFLIFIVGILVESIGTNTGLLFGDYTYGNVLGGKVFAVPLIIGVNWATMVVASSTLIAPMHGSLFVKTVLAATIMVAVDFLIEPVAVKLGFWTWKNGHIPIFNYVCWFVISLPMHYFYMKWKLVENNTVPKVVFALLTIFFLVLNFV